MKMTWRRVMTKNAIRKLRAEHDLTQEQLAEAIGVSRQMVAKWESCSDRSAECIPSVDNLALLAHYFNVTISNLIVIETERIA